MPGVVQAAMDKVATITGRQYKLFDYVGHPEVGTVQYLHGQLAYFCFGQNLRQSKQPL